MDMANQLIQTSMVVRLHSGANTRDTLSNHASSGPRRALGMSCDVRVSPLYEAWLASIEVLLKVDRRCEVLGRAGGMSSSSSAAPDGEDEDAMGGELTGVCIADSYPFTSEPSNRPVVLAIRGAW
jgi:hypothetical protein